MTCLQFYGPLTSRSGFLSGDLHINYKSLGISSLDSNNRRSWIMNRNIRLSTYSKGISKFTCHDPCSSTLLYHYAKYTRLEI